VCLGAKGVQHGVRPNRQNWLEQKTLEAAELGTTKQPYCLIVGGGQGGIILGARLKQLEVPTIIIAVVQIKTLAAPFWPGHTAFFGPDPQAVKTIIQRGLSPQDSLNEWAPALSP
jgi:hypothetical protein